MSTATITAQDINKLRQATGAGMMDCRKALTETGGDFEAAIDWLRKQGQKVAAKPPIIKRVLLLPFLVRRILFQRMRTL